MVVLILIDTWIRFVQFQDLLSHVAVHILTAVEFYINVHSLITGNHRTLLCHMIFFVLVAGYANKPLFKNRTYFCCIHAQKRDCVLLARPKVCKKDVKNLPNKIL